MQAVLDVSNEVAAELAGIGDGVLHALRDRLGCTVNLRGNRLTLGGDDVKVAEAQAVVEELVELVEGGQEIGAGTVDAILGAIDQARTCTRSSPTSSGRTAASGSRRRP
jgi:Phosphate starvation-inducible protein PhoH, predicted ATPase